MRIEAEFRDDIEAIPDPDRIYLHFLHRIVQARSKCVVWIIGEAQRRIRSTSDALKFLEYVCPEEFGSTARGNASLKKETLDLNHEITRIFKGFP